MLSLVITGCRAGTRVKVLGHLISLNLRVSPEFSVVLQELSDDYELGNANCLPNYYCNNQIGE